jgi:lipoprotein LprG
MRRFPAVLQRLALIAFAAGALGACGGSAPNPETLLTQAKVSVDSAASAHFELSSSNVSGAGPFITGGTGDIARPSSFTGSLEVEYGGLVVGVQVVSVNGSFYVHLPTSSGFQITNPADYGFGDPSQLMNPSTGLSALLLHCASPSLQSDDRLNGEQLHEVSCTLPGSYIKSLLTDAEPSQTVSATFGISVDSGQLRRVVLTGPFYSSHDTTFTLVLDNYGENVTVTPPAQ